MSEAYLSEYEKIFLLHGVQVNLEDNFIANEHSFKYILV